MCEHGAIAPCRKRRKEFERFRVGAHMELEMRGAHFRCGAPAEVHIPLHGLRIETDELNGQECRWPDLVAGLRALIVVPIGGIAYPDGFAVTAGVGVGLEQPTGHDLNMRAAGQGDLATTAAEVPDPVDLDLQWQPAVNVVLGNGDRVTSLDHDGITSSGHMATAPGGSAVPIAVTLGKALAGHGCS